MILLVEDNDNDMALMLRILQQQVPADCIQTVRDGEAALQLLERQEGEPPSLVLLDLQLPKVSGLEVLQRLRSSSWSRHTPVVVVTGSEATEDIASSYDFGANSFLRKSSGVEKFEETVRQIVPYWLRLNLPLVNRGAPC